LSSPPLCASSCSDSPDCCIGQTGGTSHGPGQLRSLGSVAIPSTKSGQPLLVTSNPLTRKMMDRWMRNSVHGICGDQNGTDVRCCKCQRFRSGYDAVNVSGS
jgi:hypothetical protein